MPVFTLRSNPILTQCKGGKAGPKHATLNLIMLKNIGNFRFIAFGLAIGFLINSIGPAPLVQAQDFALPQPGIMVNLSPAFAPPVLKGIKVHPDNPFRFEFILDKGDNSLPLVGRVREGEIKQQATKLIKYFLASLTIPEKDLWVNLSPYEKNRIVPESFGQTEMGRDLLAEDYMLKQITASLIYPEGETGKKFWQRIYAVAARRFGTTNIPVNTFNKVWIVPEKAVVYENTKAETAYVVASKLKVMLEQDYLSLEKHEGILSGPQRPKINQLGSQIVRDIVIPELTKEVNEDRNFSQLRQAYNSLILATWYKKKIKYSVLEQVYGNKNKVAGVNIDDPDEKQRIYERYLQAFKKGVFNYIIDTETPDGVSVPRKYFSGGVDETYLGTEISYSDQLSDLAMNAFKNDFILKVQIDNAMRSKNLRRMKLREILLTISPRGRMLISEINKRMIAAGFDMSGQEAINDVKFGKQINTTWKVQKPYIVYKAINTTVQDRRNKLFEIISNIPEGSDKLLNDVIVEMRETGFAEFYQQTLENDFNADDRFRQWRVRKAYITKDAQKRKYNVGNKAGINRNKNQYGEEVKDRAMKVAGLDKNKIKDNDENFYRAVDYFNDNLIGKEATFESILTLYEIFRGDDRNQAYSSDVRNKRLASMREFLSDWLKEINMKFTDKHAVIEHVREAWWNIVNINGSGEQLFLRRIAIQRAQYPLKGFDKIRPQAGGHPADGHHRLAWFMMNYILLNNDLPPLYLKKSEQRVLLNQDLFLKYFIKKNPAMVASMGVSLKGRVKDLVANAVEYGVGGELRPGVGWKASKDAAMSIDLKGGKVKDFSQGVADANSGSDLAMVRERSVIEIIENLRISYGLNKANFAKRLGIAKEQYSLWINGKESLRLSTVARIAKNLGLKPKQKNELFGQWLKEHPIKAANKLGELLIQARISLGLTREQLAEKTGLSIVGIINYEVKGIIPSERILGNLAYHLGLDKEMILNVRRNIILQRDTDENDTSLGGIIKRQRISKGLSLKEITQKSVDWFRAIEKGLIIPSVKITIRLAEQLGLDKEALLQKRAEAIKSRNTSKKKPGDVAMIVLKNNTPGGIDLTVANKILQTQSAAQAIKFHIDAAQLAQLQNAPGFVPVIINIQPLKSLQEFLQS